MPTSSRTRCRRLPEAAAERGSRPPLAFMRKYGAFEIPYGGQERDMKQTGLVEERRWCRASQDGHSEASAFKTPSRRSSSSTRRPSTEWGLGRGRGSPGYIRSPGALARARRGLRREGSAPHVPPPHPHSHPFRKCQVAAGDQSHTNPLWVHPGGCRTPSVSRTAVSPG